MTFFITRFKQACFAYSQYLLPKHYFSHLIGKIAESRVPWLKNKIIALFLRAYPTIDMAAANIEDPFHYPSFNAFFTRHLKPELRPFSPDSSQLISPVDGIISQIGKIDGQQLFQAKGFYFDLSSLLGGDMTTAALFENGQFTTIYLAPYHYHRVHLPCDAQLRQVTTIPGHFFSVNQATANYIPNLYSRNERLVALFDTAFGPMAVILVGAMLVGSIQTVWPMSAARKLHTQTFPSPLAFKKGDEIGHFQMGSTVILLFPAQTTEWAAHLSSGDNLLLGQTIARV